MDGNRVERLFNNVKDVDCILIMNGSEPFLDSSFQYITGLTSGVFEDAIAFISPDGSVNVLVNQLEEKAIKSSCVNTHIYRNKSEYQSAIKELLRDTKRVGINAPSATYSHVENLKKIKDIEILDVSNAISATMAVKDKKEIKAIKNACRITSNVAKKLPEMICDGISEKEVAAEIDIMMRKSGSTGNAFDTIVAFGPNSAECHHRPNSYKLKSGNVALFDFGSKYDMYCSDLTRTIFFKESNKKLKRAYEIVKKAQLAGIKGICDGVKANEVDLIARKIIDDSEFKGLFIHSFGHGIGMDVHQPIHVSPNSEQILRAGNVISAEPGVYIPGVGGIRIEDTVLVTENGCKVLTNYDHSYTLVR